MYSREIEGQTLNFEASGGLLKGSLVIQDDETSSYWSIMTGDAIGGRKKGAELEELPVGQKVQWKDWVQRHPDTVVLSVDGVEDQGRDAYADYMTSDRGFRGAKAVDTRLETKEPVYTFRSGDQPVAVPFKEFEGGAVFEIDGKQLFLYRPKHVSLYHSTVAFMAVEGVFEKVEGIWKHTASNLSFDPQRGTFGGGENQALQRLPGFDTFWYNWSLINENSTILKAKHR